MQRCFANQRARTSSAARWGVDDVLLLWGESKWFGACNLAASGACDVALERHANVSAYAGMQMCVCCLCVCVYSYVDKYKNSPTKIKFSKG